MIHTPLPLVLNEEGSPLIRTNPSPAERLAYIHLVSEARQGSHDIQTALKLADEIFAAAGIVMPGSVKTRRFLEGCYVQKGAPKRGDWVRLRRRHVELSRGTTEWRDCLSWDDANCLAQVTTRKPFKGRNGAEASSMCFNVRTSYSPDDNRLDYAPNRIYVVDEGDTWRYPDA